jgi:hypothetical protein
LDETILDKARVVMREIGARARSEPAYAQQLAGDPVGTMVAAGIPVEVVGDILIEDGLSEEEVQGYLSSFGSVSGHDE